MLTLATFASGRLLASLLLTLAPSAASATRAGGSAQLGYYRMPALHGDTVLFTAEGDLWTVGIQGGVARRLTSGAGEEQFASVSPDGKTVAFSATYEGPLDVYTMPLSGGVPQRRTWDGDDRVAAWTPDGRILVRTRRFSTLPDPKLVAIDSEGRREILPLAQATEGVFSSDGKTLFFTRLPRQPSQTKRYQGGTAENLWRYEAGSEAVPLTADWPGTSHNPMFWQGRVFFLSDRDGVMNVYSMDRDGHALKQETHQRVFDVQHASLSEGRIAYQAGADVWLLDLASGHDSIVPIILASDFDQLRDHWVKKPLDYLTNVRVAPDGSSAVFTSRGEIFTLPVRGGRIVRVAGDSAVRYSQAVWTPDGKSIVALSTQTGESEFWKYPANGVGPAEQVTRDATVLRWEGVVSPDGHWLAHHDKNQQLWVTDLRTKKAKLIATSVVDNYEGLTWSPDSQWLAYVEYEPNSFGELKVYNVVQGDIHGLTSDRYNTSDPAWSADGKWLYYLSDRYLKTTVRQPWGTRQPDPNFDRSRKIYELALVPGLHSPFSPPDELTPGSAPDGGSTLGDAGKAAKETRAAGGGGKGGDAKKASPERVVIDFDDLSTRLREVPVPPRNYAALQATEKRLCWLDVDQVEVPAKLALACVDIANQGDGPETVVADVKGFEVSADRKKFLVRKEDDFAILDSDVKAAALGDAKVWAKAKLDLGRWSIMTQPKVEFRQLFLDSWRLERDYFYDPHMHGLNWAALRDRYLPLVDRVTDRNELNDVIAQMVGELGALHIFVAGGDVRPPGEQVDLAALGAVLRRDPTAGGLVVAHIYRHDPDLPNLAPPLSRPDSLVHEGEVITSIDGQGALALADERAALRGKAGRKVLIQVKSAKGVVRSVLVIPFTAQDEGAARYREWEYTRRLHVESASKGRLGYVHLQAMGADDMEQFAREFYPAFDRDGLIIDVRHNHGGNIDSWLLSKLMRKAWMYWQPRVGIPTWNMQYAFRGPMVVICDQVTASDGEAFAEGFRRLGLGKVIGMRTWGGEIWLSGSNHLADKGIATAAETGVYGPERKWLIEGHGVDPDIIQDNLPHATFLGADAQLDEAVRVLQEEITASQPVVPAPPPYPNKVFPTPGPR